MAIWLHWFKNTNIVYWARNGKYLNEWIINGNTYVGRFEIALMVHKYWKIIFVKYMDAIKYKPNYSLVINHITHVQFEINNC